MGSAVLLSDVDISNTVFFKMTNTHYRNSLIMDFAYEYPQDKLRILEMFKFAQRLDLEIEYNSINPDACEWLDELYDTYIKMGD